MSSAETPPSTLYFACSAEEASQVLISGLAPDTRVEPDPESARKHAKGAGKVVVFTVYAEAAHSTGQQFRTGPNGLWLTPQVDPDFLYLPPVRGAE